MSHLSVIHRRGVLSQLVGGVLSQLVGAWACLQGAICGFGALARNLQALNLNGEKY